MTNKAHTATLNRIAQRYGIEVRPETEFDIQSDSFLVEVETSATLATAIERLSQSSLPAYIAVTNKEGLQAALKKAEGTTIGVMDPQGNVIRPAVGHEFPPNV